MRRKRPPSRAGPRVRSALAILHHRLDAEALQELGWRHAARLDDHGVVGQLEHALLAVAQGDAVLLDAEQLGGEPGAHGAAGDALLDAPLVLAAAARELLAAIAQRNRRAASKVGERERALHGAVAASDDHHVLAAKFRGLEQTIDDLGALLAGHVELARRTAA